jgi:hypothetical protein
MVIFEMLQALRRLSNLRAYEPDTALDHWIREALVEDMLAQPSPGAWDRLRKTIVDCRHKGMWVLDEPMRDPPESLPMALEKRDFARAQQLYSNSRSNRFNPLNNPIWNGMMPTYTALINW